MRRAFAIAVCTVFAALLVQPGFAWQQYSATDLGAFTSKDSWDSGINASGASTGNYNLSNGYSRAAIWSNGGLTTIGTLGGMYSVGSAINDNGLVVGRSSDSSNIVRAFVFRNGQLESLQALGTGATRAYGINDAAQIVGSATTSSGQTHAALWADSVVHDLGVIYGDYSEAYAVNERGWIVGTSSISNGGSSYAHAFVYKNGAMTALDSQLDLNRTTRSTALDINYAGTAVGSITYGGRISACWWKNGAISYLGNLGKDSQAQSINGLDQVVGYSVLANGSYSAFLWQNGQMADLNNLIAQNTGITLSYANGINDSGQIVGSGLINGVSHAFLLTPLPEPSTILALAGGLIGLLGLGRRKA